MKHLLTFTKTYWAVILVAAIGFETYGCSDSASVSEDVAVPLSSLTITPGNLQPGFFKNTTSYTFRCYNCYRDGHPERQHNHDDH